MAAAPERNQERSIVWLSVRLKMGFMERLPNDREKASEAGRKGGENSHGGGRR
jgi:hypothetical protein